MTDKLHLADTIVKGSSIPVTREYALSIIDKYLDRCVEVYHDGVLSGYVVILKINDEVSFHGYKLVRGYSVAAFRIARDIVNEYKNICITSTSDKTQVRRISKLLGFQETMNVIKMERKI